MCDGPQAARNAEFCRRYGLGIEVQAFCVPELYLEDNPGLLEQTRLETAGLSTVTMHGPYRDLNTGSADRMVRETAAYRYRQAYEMAVALGCSGMVLHNGCVRKDKRYASWVQNTIVFWKDFLAEEQNDFRNDFTFYLENLCEQGPDMLSDVLDGIGSFRVRACLDVGHAHCYSLRSVVDWVVALGSRIGYVHLHDNDGQTDGHFDLGEGTIPFEDVCASLEQCAPRAFWALEADGGSMVKSLHWLRGKGYLKP